MKLLTPFKLLVLTALLLCVLPVNAASSLITFADPEVERICVAQWDTDGDGRLSQAEAAAVTSVSNVFQSNKTITSFDELRFFTGLTSISDFSFYGCPIQTIRCAMPRASIGLALEQGVMNTAQVIVPAGTKSDYMSVEGWNKFKNFSEE